MLRWLKKIFQVFLVVGVAALTSIPFKRMTPQPTTLPVAAEREAVEENQPPLQLQQEPADAAAAASRPLPVEEPPAEKPVRAEVRASTKIPRDPEPTEHLESSAPPPALGSQYEPISGSSP